MEKLTIKAPEGYEFSGVSDNGEIEFVPIKKQYPISVGEIRNRRWYITGNGIIHELEFDFSADRDINNVSTKERAEAILALTQLLELRDAWNRVDGFVVDWNLFSQRKYCMMVTAGKISIEIFARRNYALFFGSNETAQMFLETFKPLIETAKELL